MDLVLRNEYEGYDCQTMESLTKQASTKSFMRSLARQANVNMVMLGALVGR